MIVCISHAKVGYRQAIHRKPDLERGRAFLFSGPGVALPPMRGACLAIGFLWAAACPGAEFLYRLPWPQGMSFTFTQVADGRITSHFTKATLHAVDIAMPVGVPVLAARAGVVEALEAEHGARAEEEPFSYEGNFVRVRHGDGTAAIYAHLTRHGVAVVVGEAVETGQLLGRSGASGDISEPQLHFAVIRT